MATNTQRITALEGRMTKVEARVTALEKTPATTPVPPTTPPPLPAGNVVPFAYNDTVDHFVSLVKDKTVGAITLDGRYALPEIYLDGIDRPALDIGPAAGRTATFIGPGRTVEGIFMLGKSSLIKGPITLHDVGFDSVSLAQAGLFEVRQADGFTALRVTARNIVADPKYNTRPITPWFAYISSKSPSGAKNITFDSCYAYGTNRSWSFIQLDSGEVPVSNVRLVRNGCTSMAYAFYGNIAGTVSLDGLAITDSGYNGYAVRFLQGNGTYKGITGGVIDDSAAGMVAA